MPTVPAAEDAEALEIRATAIVDAVDTDDEDFWAYHVLVREKGEPEEYDLMFDYSFTDPGFVALEGPTPTYDLGQLRIAETHVIDARHVEVVVQSRSLVRISIAKPLVLDEGVRRLVTFVVNVTALPGSATTIAAKMKQGLVGP